MILNYLKLSFRLLTRNPFFTLINVLGLSIGFALFFILWQYSQNELSSDQFHKDWKRIVRFGCIPRWTDDKVNWEEAYFGITSPGLTEKIGEAYPQIEEYTRIHVQNNFKIHGPDWIKHGPEITFTHIDQSDKRVSFIEHYVAYADANLFKFFSLPLIRGNSSQVLDQPGSVVLSEKISRKYFGNEDPVGKTMSLNDSIDLHVTGVFKDLPQNSHLDFEILLSTQTSFPSLEGLFGFHCYFKLNEGVDVAAFSRQVNADSKKEIKQAIYGDDPYGTASIFLQPIAEMSFKNYRWDFYKTKSAFVLNLFKYSAIIILIVAWINYINLNISSNKVRLKEIIARKAVGASPSSFAVQFTVESMVTNVISCLVALTIIQLVKQPVATIFHLYVLPWSELSISGYVILGSVCLAGILITGLYPCWVTMINGPRSLFGASHKGTHSGSVHSSLATFQYCTAIVILMLGAIVYSQINFVLNKHIGWKGGEVLVLDLPIGSTHSAELSYLHHQIARMPQVLDVTISQSVPGGNSESFITMLRSLNDASMMIFSNGGVDEKFIPFYDIKILSGRNFDNANPADTSSIILSEGAIQRLGFKDASEAVGSTIFVGDGRKTTVIGVVAEYKLRPFLIFANEASYGGKPGVALTFKSSAHVRLDPRKVSVKIEATEVERTVAEIKDIYTAVFPRSVFNWSFLDDLITRQYRTDKETRSQITLFAVVALLISGLGLLGMISNKVVQKTKEIGIRRVLGAQMHKIALLVASETIRQVCVATLIGLPAGYYIARQYLERFSERITIQWWHYTAPVLILLVIMTVVISSVLRKTATINPVEALRYE